MVESFLTGLWLTYLFKTFQPNFDCHHGLFVGNIRLSLFLFHLSSIFYFGFLTDSLLLRYLLGLFLQLFLKVVASLNFSFEFVQSLLAFSIISVNRVNFSSTSRRKLISCCNRRRASCTAAIKSRLFELEAVDPISELFCGSRFMDLEIDAAAASSMTEEQIDDLDVQRYLSILS